MANIASFFLSTFNDQHKQGWNLDGDYKFVDADGKNITNVTETNDTTITVKGTTYTKEDDSNEYVDEDGNSLFKVPDTINFYGQADSDGYAMNYQYRYDPVTKSNYLYRYETNDYSNGDLLSGVQIINAMEVNVKFSENRGDRYLAATTSKQYVETTAGEGTWQDMAWSNRTGDGTNAVYMSELFNISMDTVISDDRANAEVYKNSLLRNKAGELIDDNGKIVTADKAIHATAMSKLSINAYYEQSMSNLGINAYSVDVNYEAMQNVIVQIQNWRDSTAGVDWNEELTHMIQFQKGFSSCSRCLTAMDEMLDRLVNSTGVVGR